MAARDPVCGMPVEPGTAKHRLRHAETDFYFCSAGCKVKFQADSARYLGQADSPTIAAVPPDTLYTCPMHPEIRRTKPGNCPICGMTLEPLIPLSEGEDTSELDD